MSRFGFVDRYGDGRFSGAVRFLETLATYLEIAATSAANISKAPAARSKAVDCGSPENASKAPAARRYAIDDAAVNTSKAPAATTRAARCGPQSLTSLAPCGPCVAVRRPRDCPFESLPAPPRTSRLPSLVGRPPLRSGRPTPSRGALASGFAAGCQRDLRSLPTRAQRALGGARHRLVQL